MDFRSPPPKKPRILLNSTSKKSNSMINSNYDSMFCKENISNPILNEKNNNFDIYCSPAPKKNLRNVENNFLSYLSPQIQNITINQMKNMSERIKIEKELDFGDSFSKPFELKNCNEKETSINKNITLEKENKINEIRSFYNNGENARRIKLIKPIEKFDFQEKENKTIYSTIKNNKIIVNNNVNENKTINNNNNLIFNGTNTFSNENKFLNNEKISIDNSNSNNIINDKCILNLSQIETKKEDFKNNMNLKLKEDSLLKNVENIVEKIKLEKQHKRSVSTDTKTAPLNINQNKLNNSPLNNFLETESIYDYSSTIKNQSKNKQIPIEKNDFSSNSYSNKVEKPKSKEISDEKLSNTIKKEANINNLVQECLERTKIVLNSISKNQFLSKKSPMINSNSIPINPLIPSKLIPKDENQSRIDKLFYNALKKTEPLISKQLNSVEKYPQKYKELIYSDLTKYEGEILNEMKHGFGTTFDKYKNIIYKGDWYNDKQHGQGILYNRSITNNNNSNFFEFNFNELSWDHYEGEFKYGVFNGMGCVFLKTGEIFNGRFIMGRINGEGSFRTKEGNIVMGEWRNNKLIKIL